jgi:hypothetical protein
VREVVPYKTLRGAGRALDNGGRLFNLFAKADDGLVSGAELARAAGVFSIDQKAFLFFEMAIAQLSSEESAAVTDQLSPELLSKLESARPRVLKPSSVESLGQAGMPAIVTGYPVFIEDRTQFVGFIMLVRPVMFIPIFDQYDVYEVYDTPAMGTVRTLIATTRGSKRLDGMFMRFGGVLKELHFEDKTGKEHGLYLDTIFYTPLPQIDAKT